MHRARDTRAVSDEVHDRIDFIFHRPSDGWAVGVPQAQSPAATLKSYAHLHRDLQAYILDPELWPMNHRAVCASFAFKKVELGPVLRP
jgi:hypothetical protein